MHPSCGRDLRPAGKEHGSLPVVGVPQDLPPMVASWLHFSLRVCWYNDEKGEGTKIMVWFGFWEREISCRSKVISSRLSSRASTIFFLLCTWFGVYPKDMTSSTTSLAPCWGEFCCVWRHVEHVDQISWVWRLEEYRSSDSKFNNKFDSNNSSH